MNSGAIDVQSLIDAYQRNDAEFLNGVAPRLKEKQIKGVLVKHEAILMKLAKALFACFRSRTEQEKRDVLFAELMSIFKEASAPGYRGTVDPVQLLDLLALEIDGLSPTAKYNFVHKYCSTLCSGDAIEGRWLELFPKFMSALDQVDSIVIDSDADTTMTGAGARKYLIGLFCERQWDDRVYVQVARIYRDMECSTEERHFIVRKLLSGLDVMALEYIPPLVHHVLHLARKDKLDEAVVTICEHFNCLHERLRAQHLPSASTPSTSCSIETLRKTEGTCLVHFYSMAKHNQEFGRSVVKLKKQRGFGMLRPFSLAVLLTLTKLERCREQILDMLRLEILLTFRHDERRRSAAWIREIEPPCIAVESVLLGLVDDCKAEWDNFVAGAIQLGFALLDTYLVKSAVKSSGALEGCAPVSSAHAASELGKNLLHQAFKVYRPSRIRLLSSVYDRIVSQPSSSVHYAGLLGKLVNCARYIVIEAKADALNFMDKLVYLNHNTARKVLHAIVPVVKMNAELRDKLLLSLRNAFFSRALEARKVAVCGLLELLEQFLPTDTANGSASACLSQLSQGFFSSHSSQSSNNQESFSQRRQREPIGWEMMCLEVIGCLRRCFTEPAALRTLLYEGLPQCVKMNATLRIPVLDLLYRQLRTIYEDNHDGAAPLKLALCVSTAGSETLPELLEPVADLVKTLCILVHVPSAEEDTDDQQELDRTVKEFLNTLCSRMANACLEDFELDKSADYTRGSAEGIKNTLLAFQLLGILEALSEYTWTHQNFEVSELEAVHSLLQLHHKLSVVLREKSVISVGKKVAGAGVVLTGKSAAATANPRTTNPITATAAGTSGVKTKGAGRTTMMSIQCVQSMLQALLTDQLPDHHEGLSVLRQNTDLVKWLVDVLDERLQLYVKQPEKAVQELEFGVATFVAKLLSHCLGNSPRIVEEMRGDVRVRMNWLPQRALEMFIRLIDIVSIVFPNNISEFWSELYAVVFQLRTGIQAPSGDELVYQLSSKFLRYMRERIRQHTERPQDGDEEEGMEKRSDNGRGMVLLLLQLCRRLMFQLSTASGAENFGRIFCMVRSLCEATVVRGMQISKALIGLLLDMSKHVTDGEKTAALVTGAARRVLGNFDADLPASETNLTALDTAAAAVACVPLVLAQVDQTVEQVLWVLKRLREKMPPKCTGSNADAEGEGAQVESAECREQRVSAENELCQQLDAVAKAMLELAMSKVPLALEKGVETTLSKLYSALTQLTKYYALLHQRKLSIYVGSFAPLVKLVGRTLTKHVNGMLNDLQETERTAAKKSRNTVGAKAKTLRQMKNVCALVYNIGCYDSAVAQLSKKMKSANLAKCVALTENRDFRMNLTEMQRAFCSTGSDDDDGEEAPTDWPVPKPRKKRAPAGTGGPKRAPAAKRQRNESATDIL